MTPKQAMQFIGGLGSPSKMPCHSWSISAFACQVGSKLGEVENSVCSKCYAMRGHYLFPVVKNAHAQRLAAVYKPEWVDAMTVAINHYEKSGFFRWFDSGDIQSLRMLEKIVSVCQALPHIKFWLPTKQYNYISQWKKKHGIFPTNLVVRLSGYMLEQRPPASLMASGVVGSAVSKVQWNCPSHKQNNKCADCRLCWNKSQKIVTYHYH